MLYRQGEPPIQFSTHPPPPFPYFHNTSSPNKKSFPQTPPESRRGGEFIYFFIFGKQSAVTFFHSREKHLSFEKVRSLSFSSSFSIWDENMRAHLLCFTAPLWQIQFIQLKRKRERKRREKGKKLHLLSAKKPPSVGRRRGGRRRGRPWIIFQEINFPFLDKKRKEEERKDDISYFKASSSLPLSCFPWKLNWHPLLSHGGKG